MSSYNVKQRSAKGTEVRKGQYYVWYLGWKECRGIAGREFTEPIAKDLVARRKNEELPKLTIDISKKELRIYQLVKVRGRTEKLKFPTVPTKDVTYAVQCLPPDEDVVACIYLGYNPTTRKAVHVHVYRCDTPETAAVFVDHLVEILRTPDHQERLASIEEQLVSHGEIIPRPQNFINMYDADSVISTTPSTVHTVPNDQELSDEESGYAMNRNSQRLSNYEDDPPGKERDVQMDSLAAELKQRLGNRTQVPILLPPQDYDTLRRIRGNMDLELFTDEYEERKCKNEDIVGVKAANKTHGILSDDLFKNSSEAIQNTPNGYLEKSPTGSSNGSSSRGRVENTKPVDMRQKQPSMGPSERMSRGSRGSGVDANIQLVSPRWKTENQVYSPPGRPTSPHLFISHDNSDSLSPASSDHRRNRSPSPRHNLRRGRSPSPGMPLTALYPAERRGRATSPRRGNETRYRSGSRGRYYDAPQVVNPYPGAVQPQPGRIPYTSGNRGMDVVRLPRTPSTERYTVVMSDPNPNLSSSLPTSVLRQYTQDVKTKDKRDKKDKKKKNRRGQEPRPDYTMYPVR